MKRKLFCLVPALVLAMVAPALAGGMSGGMGGMMSGGMEGMGQGQHIMLSPDEVKWVDPPSLPGVQMAVLEGDPKQAEPITLRLKLPPNYALMPHTHAVPERVTVLTGALYFGLGEKLDKASARKFPAGGFFVAAPDTPMYAFTKDEETIIQINVAQGPWGISYMGEKMEKMK